MKAIKNKLLIMAVLSLFIASCGGGGSGSGFSPSNAIILTEGDCSGNRTTGCSIDLSLAPYSRTPNRTIESSEDKDFYKLIVPSSGIINIWTEGNIDSEGQLLDTDGEIIAPSALKRYSEDRAAGDFNFLLSYAAVAGDYYIVVGGSREGIYRLGFSFISDSSDGLKDGDEDGIPDGEDNCVLVRNNDQLNTDGDNEGDVCDADDDNDGVLDGDEAVGCALVSDCDDDGVLDGEDNCVLVRNNDQLNTDGDNEGNVCDADDDNDKVPDSEEVAGCQLLRDCDKDGTNDGIDIDDDGDSLIEIWTAAMLDNARYVLNGAGYKESAAAMINKSGCGGDGSDECVGYELVANLSLASYASGEGWLPLGHDTKPLTFRCQGAPFSALFEGNGMTVKDLTISRVGEDCVGLFGFLSGDAWIRNLNVEAGSILGRNRVGGLVGDGGGATIMHSAADSGSVNGSGGNVGGLVGNGEGATIMHSAADSGSVSGSVGGVGGLVGNGEGATIMHSAADSGSVSGSSSVGGLVGDGGGATIMHSAADSGSVSGSSSVGGLVGWGRDAKITNSSAVSGLVNGRGGNVGGLVGFGGGATIMHSAADSGSVSGGSSVGGLVGWGSDANLTSSSADSGSVSGGSSVGGLVGSGEFTIIRNSYVVSGSVNGNGGNVGGLMGWGRDANITTSSAVSGLVNGSGGNVGGLVGSGDRATITRSAADSGSVSGGSSVGGLMGFGGNATLMNSSAVSGLVSGRGSNVGGLVGWGRDARLTSSAASSGLVSGDTFVGGLVGVGWFATIRNSYMVSGAVNGSGDNVGGLVGWGRGANITNSYMISGSVSGANSVGGLAGDGMNANITNSYAVSGSVNGSGNNVGGLVGFENGGTINNSYWDSDTSGILAGSDGEPQTSVALRAPISAMGIYANWNDGVCGWDFGSASDYPALLCLPAGPQEQRSFYSVSGGEVTIHLPE